MDQAQVGGDHVACGQRDEITLDECLGLDRVAVAIANDFALGSGQSVERLDGLLGTIILDQSASFSWVSKQCCTEDGAQLQRASANTTPLPFPLRSLLWITDAFHVSSFINVVFFPATVSSPPHTSHLVPNNAAPDVQ
jgi:hypothetical protein